MATTDSERVNASRIVAHGLGVGRLAARRYLTGLDADGWRGMADEILRDVEYAQSLAQANDGDVRAYVEELIAKGPAIGATGAVEMLYRAGFDAGFSSEVVEALEQPSPAPRADARAS